MKTLEIKKVKIGEQEYPVKMSVRAMISYETLTGHDINIIKTLDDVVKLFYCTIKAGGCELDYNKFVDLIDDDPQALKSFTDAMIEKSEGKPKAR